MAERCHGYNVSVGYTAHFFRVPATELDLLLLDTWLSANSDIDQAALAAGLTERLQRLERGVNFQGAVVPDDELHSRTEYIAKVFIDQVVPRWRMIGVLQ